MLPPLHELQKAFRDGVFGGDFAHAGDAIGSDHIAAAERLAIYRTNTLSSLAGALSSAFPVVGRLVGESFFRGAATAFVKAHPPSRPQLLAYGADFPTFLAGFEPAGTVPYLADIARLEWAMMEAYFGPTAPPLDLARLAGRPEADLVQARFAAHPTLRVVTSPFPIYAIWHAHQTDPVGRVDLSQQREDVLVVRPDMKVEAIKVGTGTAKLVERLSAGDTISAAAGAAVTQEPSFDLESALARLFSIGAFTDVEFVSMP